MEDCIEEYLENNTSLELMAISLPHVKNSDPIFCAECGEEILKEERKYRVEDGHIHQRCYKPSNVVFLVPIGCEN